MIKENLNQKVERVWNYRVRGTLTIEIGKLL